VERSTLPAKLLTVKHNSSKRVMSMSSRSLHPLSVRLPRAERDLVIGYARSRRVSISSVLKTALRRYLPGVHAGVDTRSQDAAAIASRSAAQSPQLSTSKGSSWGDGFGLVDAPSVNLEKGFVDDHPHAGPFRSRRLQRREAPRDKQEHSNWFLDD
jgi:hypothetical protein